MFNIKIFSFNLLNPSAIEMQQVIASLNTLFDSKNICCNKNLFQILDKFNTSITLSYQQIQEPMKIYLAMEIKPENLPSAKVSFKENGLEINARIKIVDEWNFNLPNNINTGLDKNSSCYSLINSNKELLTYDYCKKSFSEKVTNYFVDYEKSLILAPILDKNKNKIGVIGLSFKNKGFVNDLNKMITLIIANFYSIFFSNTSNNFIDYYCNTKG